MTRSDISPGCASGSATSEEEVELPATWPRWRDLLGWLRQRGEGYEAALAPTRCDPRRDRPGARRRTREQLRGAREIAPVPADDRRLSLPWPPSCASRIQSADFDLADEIAAADRGAARHRRGGHLQRALPRRRRPARGARARTLSGHGRGRDRPYRRGGGTIAGRSAGSRSSTATARSRRATNIVLVVAAVLAPAGGIRCRLLHDGLPEDPRALLEEGAPDDGPSGGMGRCPRGRRQGDANAGLNATLSMPVPLRAKHYPVRHLSKAPA